MTQQPIIRHTYTVLEDVRRERDRQEQLRRDGKFPYTCADPAVPDMLKLPIVGEEYGEVCKVLCELSITMAASNRAFVMNDRAERDRLEQLLAELQAQLRAELVQLAASSVAWVEALTDD